MEKKEREKEKGKEWEGSESALPAIFFITGWCSSSTIKK